MKVGDRVRINDPDSQFHRMEARIWRVEENSKGWVPELSDKNGHTAYMVDVDGVGKGHPDGESDIAFVRHELIPIQPLGSWETINAMCGKDIRKTVKEKV
jgi:hypothetical protein